MSKPEAPQRTDCERGCWDALPWREAVSWEEPWEGGGHPWAASLFGYGPESITMLRPELWPGGSLHLLQEVAARAKPDTSFLILSPSPGDSPCMGGRMRTWMRTRLWRLWESPRGASSLHNYINGKFFKNVKRERERGWRFVKMECIVAEKILGSDNVGSAKAVAGGFCCCFSW